MRYAVHLFDVAATCCLKLGRLSNFRATFDLLLSTNQLVAYTSQLKSTKPHNRTINLLQATNQPEVDPCMPALTKLPITYGVNTCFGRINTYMYHINIVSREYQLPGIAILRPTYPGKTPLRTARTPSPVQTTVDYIEE